MTKLLVSSGNDYVLGHSSSELRRLQAQGSIFGDATLSALQRAGISPGMRVLDLGCGVGDVSLLAAQLVGSSGEVVGVDQAASALELGRERAAQAGLSHLSFRLGEIESFDSDEPFDAVIGRFILLYIPGRVDLLRRLRGMVNPGGVLSFSEMDVSSAQSHPALPLFADGLAWVERVYKSAGIEPNMGSRLNETFQRAGLAPQITAQAVVEGGTGSRVYSYFSETLRSLAGTIVNAGIATSDAVDPNTFAERLRAQAGEETCFFFPRLVSAWARV